MRRAHVQAALTGGGTHAHTDTAVTQYGLEASIAGSVTHCVTCFLPLLAERGLEPSAKIPQACEVLLLLDLKIIPRLVFPSMRPEQKPGILNKDKPLSLPEATSTLLAQAQRSSSRNFPRQTSRVSRIKGPTYHLQCWSKATHTLPWFLKAPTG